MPQVTIIGGGLAGMTAALRLLERGCTVTLYEAGERLGGKAGATLAPTGDDYDEHGYHIFPAWYLNTWQLVQELGIQDHFVDCTDFKHLRAGQFPHYRTLHNITALGSFWPNLFSGILPPEEMFLFFYAALDLMHQPYRNRALLDQVSVVGFLRSRCYRTEHVATEFQDLMLKGISVPTYDVSAKTMQNVMRYWLRYPQPMYRILRGNLQQFFIAPLEERLRSLGCAIHLGIRLERLEVEGTRVTALHLRTVPTGSVRVEPVEQVIVAVPAEQLAPLVDDAVYAAAPRLGQVRYLRARPMAALNLYLTRRLPNLPKDHLNLLGSRFNLSLIDVSQTWEGYEHTVLNVIASDFTALETLSDDLATALIVAELQRFLPTLRQEDIAKAVFQSHLHEPLFSNDVGIWPYRLEALPRAASDVIELVNLHPAGDHCRTHVDLVCMEGAVTSGLKAADAVQRAMGLRRPVRIRKPQLPAWWIGLLGLGTYGLLPLAAAALVVSRGRAWLAAVRR
jgi:uncharacterized protein with NAD-binding domain and iron-sulfur cluster